IEKTLVFADRRALPLDTVQEPLYLLPPSFACGLRGIGPPLGLDGIALCERVWVEPVSADSDLAAELRGWYTPRGRRLVENEYGNRFYFGTYGAKWLAFESCLDK
ncbi:MAG: hypothetical protein FWD16_05670, partial [Clostridia bacterium]|nr:hypothetical protein [Clostridia bacterium]